MGAGRAGASWRLNLSAMRAILLTAMLAVLAACGEAQGTDAHFGPATLTGEYVAASGTAREATGAVSIERGGLLFEKGVVLYTRTLNPRSGFERIARDGQSYTTVADVPTDLTIELRRVTEQVLSGHGEGLCGDVAPGYVALAYGERAKTVTLLVFAGDEPPGPNATGSRLCATLAYTVPGGARSSQGVVLW
jgi:hypothetical protein